MKPFEERAVSFLKEYYNDAMRYVADSEHYADYAKEKIYHSMQVIGAMKYIMKHEEIFQSGEEEFVKCAEIATILHDVGRFEEIKKLYDKNISGCCDDECDHGQIGCDILRNSHQYNNIMIYLPVKHHNQVSESLYEDEEFLSIKDESLKEKIEKIVNLVRDADKAANYYLFNGSLEKLFPNMFSASKKYKGQTWKISDDAREDFGEKHLLRSSGIKTYLDVQLRVMAWFFDMNYEPTIDLVVRNGSLKKMFLNTVRYCQDEEEKEFVRKILNEFSSSRWKEKAISF